MTSHLTPEQADELTQLAYGAIDAAVQAERSGVAWGRTQADADRDTWDADRAQAREAERALLAVIRALSAPLRP